MCGKSLIANSTGAIYWPAERLCWSQTSIWRRPRPRRRAGAFLPPYDTRETLIRLAEAIDRYQPRRGCLRSAIASTIKSAARSHWRR